MVAPPLWHLVEESVMEAEFLWTRLDEKLDAHDHTLTDVEAWVEGRLLGALDGVLLAGAAVIDPWLVEALEERRDLGLVSAASYLLAMLANPAADRALQAALRRVTEDRVTAIARGLGRAGRVPALYALWENSHDAPPLGRAALLEALTFCGASPHTNWHALLNDPEPRLRHAAASSLRFVPVAYLDAYVAVALNAEDRGVRARAIAAGVAAGSTQCWRRCLQELENPDAHSGPLLLLAGLLGSKREIDLLIRALKEPALCRDALWALGFAGTTSAVEACLAQMETGTHARVAGEAVCAITGLDVPAAQPAELHDTPTPDADDSEVIFVPTPDDFLRAPDAAGLRQRWAEQASRFDTGVAYLGGQPKTLRTLRTALEHGPTRRRHPLALELSARSGGAHVIQTLDFCRRQRQQLSQAPARDSRRALMGQPLAEA